MPEGRKRPRWRPPQATKAKTRRSGVASLATPEVPTLTRAN